MEKDWNLKTLTATFKFGCNIIISKIPQTLMTCGLAFLGKIYSLFHFWFMKNLVAFELSKYQVSFINQLWPKNSKTTMTSLNGIFCTHPWHIRSIVFENLRMGYLSERNKQGHPMYMFSVWLVFAYWRKLGRAYDRKDKNRPQRIETMVTHWIVT